MDSGKIRKKFLEFFKKRGYQIAPSSSLIPADPSVLFTTAGMQQFKPYYLGEKSPYGNNVATCQKCLRTSDIEEVGDQRHLTFFEMLGNFSFGGLPAKELKKEAIKLAYEFLTKELKLKIDYVTIFSPEKIEAGDWRKDILEDKESFKIWQELGVEDIRKEGIDNFWGPTGEEGPCGPTTEIYAGGIEIWNIVFNQYYCQNKKLKELKQPGIDTGMGLERLAMVVQKKPTIFETDLFEPMIKEIGKISDKNYKENEKLFRIVADHIKASVFLATDGVIPSNVEQGYILRRLLRRAIRYGKILQMPGDFIASLTKVADKIYKSVYFELKEKKTEVAFIIKEEAEKFEKTLESGIRNISSEAVNPGFNGEKAYNLYATTGVPFDIIKEIAEEKGIKIDKTFEIDFEKGKLKHQELSRTASSGMFKGGLAEHTEKTINYHTATHLLLAALRQVLGDSIFQKGSNITIERLRFDFSHTEKMTPEQIKKTEDIVNEKIKQNLKIKFEEIPLDEAKKTGAMGVFGEKYGNIVKVYTIFNEKTGEIFSREICGGPHVDSTAMLGYFKIIKEESSSAGVRRIKAILEK